MVTNTSICSSARGLFDESSNAVVMGLPPEFDLPRIIESSAEIRLATAFAHWSGWRLIKDAIRNSNAALKLLTGLDFCQTDPKVLKDWLSLGEDHRAFGRIYIGDAPTFHPKILIVSGPTRRFAVVGSANLSEGGFRNNVECSIFLEDKKILDDLESWFDALFGNESVTKALSSQDVLEYESIFNTALDTVAFHRATQKQIKSKLVEHLTSRAPSKRDDLMLPVLRVLGDEAPHSSEQIRKNVLGSEVDSTDTRAYKRYSNWADWCLVELQGAELITKQDPTTSIYGILGEGIKLLEQKPTNITTQTLKQIPAYRYYQSKKAIKAAQTRKRKSAYK